ncbi:MAG: hypothetical protein KC432_04500, partial [Thermomicrobiales bacterium]|nr:hypothetical protein [Thermomicrobiales bacterium]
PSTSWATACETPLIRGWASRPRTSSRRQWRLPAWPGDLTTVGQWNVTRSLDNLKPTRVGARGLVLP